MSVPVAEKRRETRYPGRGTVVVRSENPGAHDIQGKLVDRSASGFRMLHECTALTAGQFVQFSHTEATGRARVVWTRILATAVESGFVLLAD